MINGKVRGGPLDGQVIISDRDYWQADERPKEDLPLRLSSGAFKCDKAVKTVTYEKIFYRKGGAQWYEWRL